QLVIRISLAHPQYQPRPKELSLLKMSESELGSCQVEMMDKVPSLAADPPPATRPFGRKCQARLWEAARYAVGYPPAMHSALQSMSLDRCWQGFWRPWGDGAKAQVPTPKLPSALAPLLSDETFAAWSCRISPPNAELRLHQAEGSDGSLLWQVEGRQQVLLLETPPAKAFKAKGSSLLKQGQTVYSPWEDLELKDPFSVVLSAGEVLCVPKGWWCSSRCLSASVCLSAALGALPEAETLKDFPQEWTQHAQELLARCERSSGAPVKHVLVEGRTVHGASSRKQRCNAVCHVQLFVGRRCCRSSRATGGPEVCFLGASRDGDLGPMEDILRSMRLSERCLVALGAPEVKLLDIELLEVLLPEAEVPGQDFFQRYMRAWWTWFQDPSEWQPLPTTRRSTERANVLGSTDVATQDGVDLPRCHRCGAVQAPARCSGCALVSYCSKSCQREDWSYHRHVCVQK
ncbi:unnamed protein product, partial [Cladocopium goreaui]